MSNLISNNVSVPLIDPNMLSMEFVIPNALRPSFAANKHLIPRFAKQLQEALQQSFEHPDTRLKGDVTQHEVKLRINLCYEAMIAMHLDEKLSLIQSLDILPGVVIDALRMGIANANHLVDGKGQDKKRWSVSAQETDVVPTGTDLNQEP